MLRAFMHAALLMAAGTTAQAQTAVSPERLELCAACHGPGGNSKMEKIPSIAGQPEFFLLNSLVLIREGVRNVEAMAPFMKDMKDDEIQALATYFAAQKPERTDEPIDQAQAQRGAQLVDPRHCSSCHKPDLSGEQVAPRIAGQRIDYLIDAITAFRDSTRIGGDPAMSSAAQGLSDADITALANYAASK
jgi:cytochrome c553